MKTINSGFNFRRARNGEHYQAHADILNAISEAFVSGQGIKALRDAYAKLYELEDECYLRNQAYEDTPEIAEADQLRDELFLFVSQTIETNKLSPVAANREAAGRLGFVLDPYKDAPRQSLAKNTAEVTDFGKAISEESHAEDVTTLGLDAPLAALKEANEAFNRLYLERSKEKEERSKSETMKTIRPKVDAAFKELATAINSLYNVNELITKDAEKEQELGAVIDEVNAILLQLQETLSRAGIGSKPEREPEEQPGTDDDTTEEPDDQPTVDDGTGDDDEPDRPVVQ